MSCGAISNTTSFTKQYHPRSYKIDRPIKPESCYELIRLFDLILIKQFICQIRYIHEAEKC